MDKYENLLQAILEAVESDTDDEVVAVPMSRYIELIRAETEKNIFEAAISGQIQYSASSVLVAIRQARRQSSPLPSGAEDTKEDDESAE